MGCRKIPDLYMSWCIHIMPCLWVYMMQMMQCFSVFEITHSKNSLLFLSLIHLTYVSNKMALTDTGCLFFLRLFDAVKNGFFSVDFLLSPTLHELVIRQWLLTTISESCSSCWTCWFVYKSCHKLRSLASENRKVISNKNLGKINTTRLLRRNGPSNSAWRPSGWKNWN